MAREKIAARTLYDELVEITYDYLGPAADRYVARQIESHLHKSPAEVQKKDLEQLIEWIKIATNHLIDDEEIVNQYIGRLEKLHVSARQKSPS